MSRGLVAAWGCNAIGWILFLSGCAAYSLPFFALALFLNVGILSSRALANRKTKALTAGPEKIDGRTNQEWYDIIKLMGKEEYERMSRPALDGLEDSEYGWDVQKLLGARLYENLLCEWYPERFCKWCSAEHNEATCLYRPATLSEHLGWHKPIKKVPSQRVTPGVDISLMSNGQGSTFWWHITWDNKAVSITPAQLKAFQRHKGLIPNGNMDTVTRKYVERYLLAGNELPIQKLTTNEARQLQHELSRWGSRDCI